MAYWCADPQLGSAPHPLRRIQTSRPEGSDLSIHPSAADAFAKVAALPGISAESNFEGQTPKRRRGGQPSLLRSQDQPLTPRQVALLRADKVIMSGISRIDEAAGFVICRLCRHRLRAASAPNRYGIRCHIQQRCAVLKRSLSFAACETQQTILEAISNGPRRVKNLIGTFASAASEFELTQHASCTTRYEQRCGRWTRHGRN